MFDELVLGDDRLLFIHFKIRCTCFDDGLVPLMADEDVVKLLEYVPMFKEVDVYVEEDVLMVEKTHDGEIDSEIRYKIHVMKEKLSQEKPSLDEIFIDINSSLESVIAKLSQDNMEMPWGTLAPDMNDDARISGLTILVAMFPLRDQQRGKKVEFDETALGYAPTGNPRKRRRLNKDERCATDFVNVVGECKHGLEMASLFCCTFCSLDQVILLYDDM
ncbi:hypothetical protein Tco_0913493 [Tanacetum coccineum]